MFLQTEGQGSSSCTKACPANRTRKKNDLLWLSAILALPAAFQVADYTWKVGSQAAKSPFSSNNPVSTKAKHVFHVLHHTRLTAPEQPQHHLIFSKSAETLNNTSRCQSALVRTTFEELSVALIHN